MICCEGETIIHYVMDLELRPFSDINLEDSFFDRLKAEDQGTVL